MKSGWKVVLILGITILVGAFIGLALRRGAIPVANPLTSVFNFSGGMELLLVPDYRLKEAELLNLGDELKKVIQQNQLTRQGIYPQIELMGSPDNGYRDGLVLIFENIAAAKQAQKSGLIPSSYYQTLGKRKKLHITSKIESNFIELSVTSELRNYSSDALKSSVQIIKERLQDYNSGLLKVRTDINQKGQIRVLIPGLKDAQEVQTLLTASGRLTFRIENKIVLDGHDLKDVHVSFREMGILFCSNSRTWAQGNWPISRRIMLVETWQFILMTRC